MQTTENMPLRAKKSAFFELFACFSEQLLLQESRKAGLPPHGAIAGPDAEAPRLAAEFERSTDI